MQDFKIFYDEDNDILYLAKKGQEEQVVEIAPGINVELDKRGDLVGVELFNASNLLKDIIQPMQRKIHAA